MGSNKKRERFLIDVAIRLLKGAKTFNIRRSHLIEPSQISKGTIYNHFPSEADLILAVGTADCLARQERAIIDEQKYLDPLLCFIFHHCWLLRESLQNDRFGFFRILPNSEIEAQAASSREVDFKSSYQDYLQWNKEVVEKMGKVEGFDRADLLLNYIKGTLINSDDNNRNPDDEELYYQFSFALAQLAGQSSKRIPSKQEFREWLDKLNNQIIKP